MDHGDWLPLGSVVTLRGEVMPVVIVGFMLRNREAGQPWDYAGFPYPMGCTRPDAVSFFDHSQIESVLLVGYEDQAARAFGTLLRLKAGQFEQEKQDYVERLLRDGE